MLRTEERRKKVLKRLQESGGRAVTGTELAKEFKVSRQIIVGDINLIRAQGETIFSTPRGYILPNGSQRMNGILATIVTCHNSDEKMRQELEIVVDNGGHVHDVIVEHPLYGAIRCELELYSRRDVEGFMRKLHDQKANPLAVVTGGTHVHTIEVPDEEILTTIKSELQQAGILVED